jgi:hypothetical protein
MSKMLLVIDCDWTITDPKYTKALCHVVDDTLPAIFRRELDVMRDHYLAKIEGKTFSDNDELSWMIRCIGVYIKAGLSKKQIKGALCGVRLRAHFRELCLLCKEYEMPVAIRLVPQLKT